MTTYLINYIIIIIYKLKIAQPQVKTVFLGREFNYEFGICGYELV